jgi:signal peptide peptidase SppA
MNYAASLLAAPWAIRREHLPLLSAVLTRIARGEPMSIEDRRAVDEGKIVARERRDQGAQAAGKSGSIAVIGVYGVLSPRGGADPDTSEPLTSMSRLASTINQAAADPSISGIVLDVDSPGGSVYGLQELGDVIYGARAAKPIAAVANSLAASAAYWAACQCEELYAAPGAEVGSIGVYTLHANVAEAMEQAGVDVTLISAGKFKTETSPYGPLSADARAHVQSSVDQYYDAFVRAVGRGRGTSLKAVREGMGQGRVLSTVDAKTENMIDGVATLGQVIAKMQARVQRGSSASSSTGRASAAQMQARVRVLTGQHEREIAIAFAAAGSAEERAELEQIYGRRA